jgi:hypothetical protein
MDFGTLKTTVLDYADRTDLDGQVAGFVALTEGLIRRDLQAMPTTATLDDSDRTGTSTGVYTLPATLDVVRAIYGTDPNGSEYLLQQVGLAELRDLRSTDSVRYWTQNGDTIEIRGVPGALASFTLHYLGHPVPLSGDSDTNDLLTNHEALYVYGSLFHLYQYTQDTELAQAALDTFSDALEKLNNAAGRKLGGGRVRNPYTFGPLRRGY